MLEKRCIACHNNQTAKSGLDLSSRERLIRGGDRGPAVSPGNASASLIYKLVAHAEAPHMPYQASQLSTAEISIVEGWINQGAPYDETVKAVAPAKPNLPDHWAFKIPRRPPVPVVTANRVRVRNPIDAFVFASQERLGLVPVAEADRRTLIRRLYLDLAGVPPSVPEIDSYLADKSPEAYERVVDRLLADSRYGERWARHWMDVWRYSDWYGWRKGNDVRNSARHMWRWRDWIVESLNQDKGYDRMILEMVAADEIAPGDQQALRATGFLARNYNKYDRNGWMQDAVDHTAAAFLGVTLKCARCHDHKYDPVSQKEYYQFRAFFEPYEARIDRVPGQPDVDQDGLSRVYDADLDHPTYLLVRGNIQDPDKEHVLAPAVPVAFGGALGKIGPVSLPVDSYFPDHREFVHADLVKQAQADLERADADLHKAHEEYAAEEAAAESAGVKAGFEKLRAAADKLELAQRTHTAAKIQVPALEARIAADRARYAEPPDPRYEDLANAARKAEREGGIAKGAENVLRAQIEFTEALRAQPPDSKRIAEAEKRVTAAQTALTQVPEGYSSIGKVYPEKSSGRRTVLAQWIASTNNPLTARVAVNHIWLRHFGKPLVPTVFDFGLNGKRPAHPELLDWLASELMEKGWSMKTIHRLIVTSSTYRMRSSSVAQPGNSNATADPENQYLWHMNTRRMEAEVVRDSILAVSGQLDPAMGGQEIDEAKGFESRRRSLYFRHSPDTQMEFLKMFDAPSPAECYMRNESVVPQQALALANSQLSREQSQVLARRLGANSAVTAKPGAFIQAAFNTVLGRPASAEELATAERFLGRQSALYGDPAHLTLLAKPEKSEIADAAVSKASPDATARARENLVHVLFNHNDFVTIR